MDNGTPFSEAGTDLPILFETVAQTIKTFRDAFPWPARETFRAGIDFDARNDAVTHENLSQ